MAESQASESVVAEAIVSLSSSFFFFHFLALLLFPLQLPSWWTPGLLSLFSLFHLLFSSILRQLTGGPGP